MVGAGSGLADTANVPGIHVAAPRRIASVYAVGCKPRDPTEPKIKRAGTRGPNTLVPASSACLVTTPDVRRRRPINPVKLHHQLTGALVSYGLTLRGGICSISHQALQALENTDKIFLFFRDRQSSHRRARVATGVLGGDFMVTGKAGQGFTDEELVVIWD